MGKFGRFGVWVQKFFRDNVDRSRRFGAGAWKSFRDNFVMLAIMLGALLLLVVWVNYRSENIKSEELGAYAMFVTASATLLLAAATTLMVRENRKLVEANEELVKQNNILINRDYIAELIAGVIEPMLSSAYLLETFLEKRKYYWNVTEESLIEGDLREILGGVI